MQQLRMDLLGLHLQCALPRLREYFDRQQCLTLLSNLTVLTVKVCLCVCMQDYPIITIEDPFDQDDWDNVTKLTLEGICQVRPKPLQIGANPTA